MTASRQWHAAATAVALALDLAPLMDYESGPMQPFHALVKNGRLTLDEPSDLPEGQVVVLLPLEELLTMAEDAGEDSNDMVTFSFAPPHHREFKKPKQVDAAAIIAELRAL